MNSNVYKLLNGTVLLDYTVQLSTDNKAWQINHIFYETTGNNNKKTT
jgi:hypothetical protein